MVRIAGQDNLDDVTGRAQNGFAATSLRGHRERVQALPSGAKLLSDFERAAETLHRHQAAFTPAEGLSHKRHLRLPVHAAAMRRFEELKEELLEVMPVAGREIVLAAERSFARAPAADRAAALSPSRKPRLPQ